MRRHAIQFHKLKGVGVPATEAEYETAVLDAAERSSWARAGAISYDRRRVRFRRPVKTEIERFPEERRISCVDPSCPVTFTRRLSMRRHAIQFHKLKGVGVPATEAEYEAAVLDAAERSSWAQAGAISYNRRRVRFRRPVNTEIERFPEERRSGEQPAPVDPPDHRDVLSRSASAADVHPAFGCEDIRDPITGEEWITEQRPEICAPVDYLHQLLRDKPTLPVQGIVDSAIRQHGWTGGMALRARFTVDYLEAGRQQILSDIRALVPETLDEHSFLLFAVRVHQYLVQFPPRPK